MVGGGLIILPKKTWNVWKRENRERVLRDERLDAEQRARVESEQARRNHEASVESLRRLRSAERAGAAAARSAAPPSKRRRMGTAVVKLPKVNMLVTTPSAPAVAVAPAAPTTDEGHINFFAEDEANARRAEEDAIKARAAATEKQREQRRLGIAPLGLGQSASAADQRWWNGPSAAAAAVAGAAQGTVVERDWRGRPLRGAAAARAAALCDRHKANRDPMSSVAAALARNAPHVGAPFPPPPPLPPRKREAVAAAALTMKKEKKKKKKKKKKEKKKRRSRSPSPPSALAALRAEREAREERERARAQALLASRARRGGVEEARWARAMTYTSGFHPELARQNSTGSSR